MARISLFHSVALAVLAAVGAMAVPAQAQTQDPDQDRQEMREARQERRAERQEQNRASPQTAAPQQAEVAAVGGWNRGNGGGRARAEARQEQAAPAQQRPAPDGGWRSQRAGDGQRYGRDWSNSGTVERPAPAWRGATPNVPEGGNADVSRRNGDPRTAGEWSGHRNRTYSDPNRDGTYGDRNDTTQTWRDRTSDHSGNYRDRYRDGHHAGTYRDPRAQSQVFQDRYNNGYTSNSRDYRRWDRNDWRRDARYNWSNYRNRNRDIYRAGRYYSPYNNYGYSRFSIGFFLNSGFYSNRYWINDPWQYRLPQAYGPYRWVRYYDDVLLVDIYSGEVVDVIHDFFW